MEQAVTPHCERSACAGQGVASSDTYCAVDMSRDTEAVQATVASPTAIKPTLNVITSGPPTSQAAVYVNTGDYGNGRMVRVYTHTSLSLARAVEKRGPSISWKYPEL